jgi:hypothetical protein
LNGVTACSSHGNNSKDFLKQIRAIKAIITSKPRCLVSIGGGVWRLLTQTVQGHRILILTSNYMQRSKGTTYKASFLFQHLDTELIHQYCNYVMSPLHFLNVHGTGSFTRQQNCPKFLSHITSKIHYHVLQLTTKTLHIYLTPKLNTKLIYFSNIFPLNVTFLTLSFV